MIFKTDFIFLNKKDFLEPRYIHLNYISPEQLDGFLSLGWFRIQQTIFTTSFLNFDGILYDAIWLRVCLHDFTADKKYKILSAKNKKFRTEIRQALITPAHENLFASYKNSISFETASSLLSLLQGDSDYNVYNTFMINVYDGERLIGSGGFDLGSNSAAGIFSVYDPAYKKFSLGKYMIYEKMLYCKRENFIYFYPGYFVPGYPSFDYKIEMGKPALEYFDIEQGKWCSFSTIKNGDF